MARSQSRSQRKASGGRYHQSRTKKKTELAGFPANTRLSPETKVRRKGTLGGHAKQSLLTTNVINVSDKKGKTTKTQILNVIENAANPHLVRRNIITKGAIVETKLGKVKVTSRPGQEGMISGMLV
ncbi:MAG: small subunit ribosomal protein S8e [archaeon GW2011_AR9]|nr:MAG: small subunit ribosomal protein S8e [archaeon GW2011_AR9]MBS3120991.1 30S ribosomal protein S8e [Candidatus Woesearchaeota archaeon]HIH13293.1 30S ribosomal protein S8e [Candidatus Woesearchaeota archaeon]